MEIGMNYSDPPDKSVCSECVEEAGLQDFISRRFKVGTCSYCDSETKVCSLNDLVPFIDECLRIEYVDAADALPYDSEEGELWGDQFSSLELLQECGLGGGSFEFVEDVANCLSTDSWASVFGLYDSTDREYSTAWEKFVNLVQKSFRYTFLAQPLESDDPSAEIHTASDLLAGLVKQHSMLVPIVSLDTSTVVYRARFSDSDRFELNAINLGPPEYKIAARYSNRMSPAGICYFYGALDPETAIAEIKVEVRSSVALGRFSCLRVLNLIDFANVMEVPSLFDENLNTVRTELKILNNFADEISKPCSPDSLLHVEYVPTQIITEYFRWCFQKNEKPVDGIIYRSSVRAGGRSVAFFFGSEACAEHEFESDREEEKVLLFQGADWVRD